LFTISSCFTFMNLFFPCLNIISNRCLGNSNIPYFATEEMIRTLVLFFLLLVSFKSSVTADCVTDPTPIACENYTIPATQVQQYITGLCSMMYMVECTVENLCENKNASGQYCDPFSIYKELCMSMMMSGCEAYESMCKSGSRVKQCLTDIPNIPNDTNLQGLIEDICTEMDMPPCSQCTIASCDSLSVYSALCKQMPMMSQCLEWKTFCKKIPNWSICKLPNNFIYWWINN